MTSALFMSQSDEVEIEGVRLVLTCGACPEQYDAFHGEERIGYLRLRHGFFRAEYPDAGGETVYRAWPRGDGIFEGDERRDFLTVAVRALKRAYGLGSTAVDLTEAAQGVVSAWEALPGGMYHSRSDVQRWLINDMGPAIDALREAVSAEGATHG